MDIKRGKLKAKASAVKFNIFYFEMSIMKLSYIYMQYTY